MSPIDGFFVMVVNEDHKSHFCVFGVGEVDLWRADHRMEADRRFIPNLITYRLVVVPVVYCWTMPPC